MGAHGQAPKPLCPTQSRGSDPLSRRTDKALRHGQTRCPPGYRSEEAAESRQAPFGPKSKTRLIESDGRNQKPQSLAGRNFASPRVGGGPYSGRLIYRNYAVGKPKTT